MAAPRHAAPCADVSELVGLARRLQTGSPRQMRSMEARPTCAPVWSPWVAMMVHADWGVQADPSAWLNMPMELVRRIVAWIGMRRSVGASRWPVAATRPGAECSTIPRAARLAGRR